MPVLLPVSHSLQNEVSTKSSEDCNGGISPPAMGCFTLLCSQILFFLILSTLFFPIFSTKSLEDSDGGTSPPPNPMGCYTLLCLQILFYFLFLYQFVNIFIPNVLFAVDLGM